VLIFSHYRALVYVTFVSSIPLLQCEAVSFIFFFVVQNYTLPASENCCLSVYGRKVEM
jgi:hypothetical protein